MRFQNIPPGNLARVEPLYLVSEPTSRGFRQGVQPECICSEPTSGGQSAWVHPV